MRAAAVAGRPTTMPELNRDQTEASDGRRVSPATG